HRDRKTKKPLRELKGTRRFLAWKRSGFSQHEMENRKQKTTVGICVVCLTRLRRRRRGGSKRRRRSKTMVFAFWGFKPASPAWAAREYRTRYGIESSYRQM